MGLATGARAGGERAVLAGAGRVVSREATGDDGDLATAFGAVPTAAGHVISVPRTGRCCACRTGGSRGLGLEGDEAFRYLFPVHGQAGVGKTWLGRPWDSAGQESGAATAYLADDVRSVVGEAMEAISTRLKRQGSPLTGFYELPDLGAGHGQQGFRAAEFSALPLPRSGRGREAGGEVQVERGARSRGGPALAKSTLDGLGNVGWQYGLGFASEPVARVRLVGGDHECCPGDVCVLDREGAGCPGKSLEVGRPASQPPAVGRTVDDDASRSLAAQCHGSSSTPRVLASPGRPGSSVSVSFSPLTAVTCSSRTARRARLTGCNSQ